MNWEIAYTNSFDGDVASGKDYKTPDDLKRAGLSVISARVPGSFECELVRLGIEQDYALSSNIKNIAKYKDTHVWYFAEFNSYDFSSLHFDRINGEAVVYINGETVLKTNCFLNEYEISDAIKEGKNSVVVHILPTGKKRFKAAGGCTANTKGIDGDVIVRRKRKCEIKNAYVRTVSIDRNEDVAKVRFTAETDVRSDCKREFPHLHYRALIKDDNRVYQTEGDVFGDKIDCSVEVPHPKLWWPRNYGRACLYDASITIFDSGKQLDVFDTKTGIRTVELNVTGKGSNDYEFTVNGNRVFLSGACTGPSELLKNENDERIEDTVAAASEMNCNVLKYSGCYAPESFYDACDKNGILVIQNIPGADPSFVENQDNVKGLTEEVSFFASKIRNHPSVAAFSYNSEESRICDGIFRSAVSDICGSIPFIGDNSADNVEFPENIDPDQLLERFGSFYTSAFGTASMPSSESLDKMSGEDQCWPLTDEEGNLKETVLCHLSESCRSGNAGADIVAGPVANLFNTEGCLKTTLLQMSQIAQAERIKQYIELYRSKSGKAGGVIAFNLIDGHPLISGSVIDYYLTKKIACGYIKRTLAPLCLMITGGENGLSLKAVNDLPYGDQVTYLIKDLSAGATLITTGISDIFAFSTSELCDVTLTPGHFYQIVWTTRAGRTYTNHYFFSSETNDFDAYVDALAKAGYTELSKE